jgi:hypothetical protein
MLCYAPQLIPLVFELEAGAGRRLPDGRKLTTVPGYEQLVPRSSFVNAADFKAIA